MGRSTGDGESWRKGKSDKEVGLSHCDMKSVSNFMKKL